MTAASSSTQTVKTLLGIWALFLAFAFVQLGNGIQRVLLPVDGRIAWGTAGREEPGSQRGARPDEGTLGQEAQLASARILIRRYPADTAQLRCC